MNLTLLSVIHKVFTCDSDECSSMITSRGRRDTTNGNFICEVIGSCWISRYISNSINIDLNFKISRDTSRNTTFNLSCTELNDSHLVHFSCGVGEMNFHCILIISKILTSDCHDSLQCWVVRCWRNSCDLCTGC